MTTETSLKSSNITLRRFIGRTDRELDFVFDVTNNEFGRISNNDPFHFFSNNVGGTSVEVTQPYTIETLRIRRELTSLDDYKTYEVEFGVDPDNEIELSESDNISDFVHIKLSKGSEEVLIPLTNASIEFGNSDRSIWSINLLEGLDISSSNLRNSLDIILNEVDDSTGELNLEFELINIYFDVQAIPGPKGEQGDKGDQGVDGDDAFTPILFVGKNDETDSIIGINGWFGGTGSPPISNVTKSNPIYLTDDESSSSIDVGGESVGYTRDRNLATPFVGSQGPQGKYNVEIYTKLLLTDDAPDTPSQDITYDGNEFSNLGIWVSSFPQFDSATDQVWLSFAEFDPSTPSISDWSQPAQAGSQGPAGQRGPAGDKGDTGPQGPKGDNGDGITSITESETDTQVTIIFHRDSGQDIPITFNKGGTSTPVNPDGVTIHYGVTDDDSISDFTNLQSQQIPINGTGNIRFATVENQKGVIFVPNGYTIDVWHNASFVADDRLVENDYTTEEVTINSVEFKRYLDTRNFSIGGINITYIIGVEIDN